MRTLLCALLLLTPAACASTQNDTIAPTMDAVSPSDSKIQRGALRTYSDTIQARPTPQMGPKCPDLARWRIFDCGCTSHDPRIFITAIVRGSEECRCGASNVSGGGHGQVTIYTTCEFTGGP